MRPTVRAFRAGFALSAVAALAVLGAVPAGAAAPPDGADGATPTVTSSGDATTVTLVTGDVVHVTSTTSGASGVTIDPAPGSTGPVQTAEIGGDLYVLPAAAEPYLASGALDERLFDVTALVADGYDDAHSGGVPVIAQYAAGLRATPKTLAGSTKVRTLSSIDGAALKTDAAKATGFWSALTSSAQPLSATQGSASASAGAATFDGGVTKLWLDGRARATLDVSVPLVGAPEAWAMGDDGTGARVAVLDSGVDLGHPDLAGKVADTESFVPGETITDVNGHGTHVTSTVVGSGAASDGKYKGVAPGAEVVAGKVLDDTGYGQDSWIIAGMEWASETEHADVVSMSLGDETLTDQSDPLAQALNTLSAQTGALFVVAAGNAGAAGTVSSPGTADAALTVAATDDQDQLASFSSQGPRGIDDALKPDVAAPGVSITAARSQYSPGTGYYTAKSGTSMATPHVAGAAAILKAAHPGWDAQRIKDAIMSSSKQLDYTPYEVGDGRLDIPAALDGVDATGSVYFGKANWGQADPAPVTRTLTYDNDTDADVTLALSSSTTGPAGAADLVHLSADHVVVPAHGTAAVQATASFADAPTPGHYLGQVVATSADGTVAARTATGLTREDERYDLDVTVIGPDGAPVAADVTLYQYGTAGIATLPTDATTGRTAARRLQPGSFAAIASIHVTGRDGTDRLYWLSDPDISVKDGDVHVVLDARAAHPLTLDTPRPSVDFAGRVEWFHRSSVGGALASFTASILSVPGAQVWVDTTGPVSDGEFDLTSRWTRTAPLLDLKGKTPGAFTLHPVYQRGSTRLDGRVDLAAVDGGTGTAAELASLDVKGKAVIVAASDAVTAAQRAQAASAAGAALLVVVNDAGGVLYDAAGGTNLPVVSLSADEGARLLGGRADKLRIIGSATAFPDYGYDVVHTWQGAVPADLTVAPRTQDLAQVTDRFADPDPSLVFLTRYDCPDYRTACMGATSPEMSGAQTVTYVSAPGAHSTWFGAADTPTGWSLTDAQRRYAAGDRSTVDWFGVVAPHQGPAYNLSSASGRTLRLNVPESSSTGDITGVRTAGVSVQSRLYQDGALLRSAASHAIQGIYPAVAGAHAYRFEMDTTVPPTTWPTSTSTSTVWTFGYDQAQPAGTLPLISLGYDVPTGLDGKVAARDATTLDVTARQVAGAVGAGTIGSARVEVSYDDGATWSNAPVRADGSGRWTVTLGRAPARASAVSLRTTVGDDAGNGITQTVVRALSLR